MITQWIVVHGPRLVWHIFVPPRDIVSIYRLLKSKPSFLREVPFTSCNSFVGEFNIITTKTTAVAKLVTLV